MHHCFTKSHQQQNDLLMTHNNFAKHFKKEDVWKNHLYLKIITVTPVNFQKQVFDWLKIFTINTIKIPKRYNLSYSIIYGCFQNFARSKYT